MLNNIDKLKMISSDADERLKVLKHYGYSGDNNIYDIVNFFENTLRVFFNRNVVVDTDDDDYSPSHRGVTNVHM